MPYGLLLAERGVEGAIAARPELRLGAERAQRYDRKPGCGRGAAACRARHEGAHAKASDANIQGRVPARSNSTRPIAASSKRCGATAAPANSAIGAELGVTEGTVRQRIKKLIDVGAFRVSGLVNPEILPDHLLCVIGLKVDESKQLETRARDVSRLAEVRSVAIVTGRYDLLVEVLVASNQGLIHFLSELAGAGPGHHEQRDVLAAQDLRQVDLRLGSRVAAKRTNENAGAQWAPASMRRLADCASAAARDLGHALEQSFGYTRPTRCSRTVLVICSYSFLPSAMKSVAVKPCDCSFLNALLSSFRTLFESPS